MENQDFKNLLLLDDDESFCDVLTRALVRHGFNVATAHNITSACTLLDKTDVKFNYAIVDLRIGQESGLEAVNKIISQEPDIKIVVLTGYASIATAVEAIKLGAKQYLTKPADIGDIIDGFGKDEGDIETQLAGNPMSIKRLEWEHLQKVLREHGGNISAAARALDMHRRTLQRKLQKKPVKH
ncbi:Dna binding response regulator PrrA (RegA) [hydrothermal vent metagenome]|uniref:Dna binding response regulator PrrA (RegA) n=1 Tax=hydrothermal vent metagenome TaxID=652676 RepID=A0A3B0ZK11_9ZZZZ